MAHTSVNNVLFRLADDDQHTAPMEFDLPPQTFIDSLPNVNRDSSYKPSYVSDMPYKSPGESPLTNLPSIYLDPSTYVQQSQSQAVEEVSSHGGYSTTGNIYTTLDQRLFPTQPQQPSLLSPESSGLYGGRDVTALRHASENENNTTDLRTSFDPGMTYCSSANQHTMNQRPNDSYNPNFVDHPTYAQNPFVYFPVTPARKPETTYQTSYSPLYPPTRPFPNVMCPADGHDFPYPTGDVFSNSPPSSNPMMQSGNRRSTEKQQRYVNASDAVDVQGVEDSCRCKNTVEGTKTSVRRFRKWYKDKFAKNLDMNGVDRNMAIRLLKDFFLEIRDTRPGKEGNEYEPVTLTTYRNGLRRYFLERKVPPAPDNFDLADKEFDIVNYHLITKRNELKRNGKGNHPNVVESITEEQLEKMWASGAIGTHSPRALLRLQWWLNTIHHGIRGRMAHHDLNIEDFQISRTLDGKLCIEYIKNTAKRKLAGDNDADYPRNKRKCKARMVATDGSDRDPVRAFEIYLKHRPPGISSFYLTPKHKPKGDIWFNKVPMGKNSIGRIMREIKAVAGINWFESRSLSLSLSISCTWTFSVRRDKENGDLVTTLIPSWQSFNYR